MVNLKKRVGCSSTASNNLSNKCFAASLESLEVCVDAEAFPPTCVYWRNHVEGCAWCGGLYREG